MINSPSCKYVTVSILNVHNVEGSGMTFSVYHRTDTTQIPTSGNHAQVTRFEFDIVQDFRRRNLQLDCVIYFYVRVGVADGTSVVGYQEWNIFWASLDSLDLAQFVLKEECEVFIFKLSLKFLHSGSEVR